MALRALSVRAVERRVRRRARAYALLVRVLGSKGAPAVLVASVVFVAALVLDAKWRGALGIARNDDWSYLRTAFDFGTHGDFRLNGWSVALLFGQVVLAAPLVIAFGRSIVALQLMVAAMGALAVWIWFIVLRRAFDVRVAAIACTTLAISPVFAGTTVTFMTDVPAMFLQTLVIFFGALALTSRTSSTRWTVASYAAGLVAFTIREYSVVAVVATTVVIGAACVVRGDRRRLAVVLAAAASFVAAATAFWFWKRSLPFDSTAIFDRVSLPAIFTRVCRAIIVGAALVAPAAVVLSPVALARSSWRASRRNASFAYALTALVLLGGQFKIAGGYLSRHGAYSSTVAGSPAITVTGPLWTFIVVMSAYSLVMIGQFAALAVAEVSRPTSEQLTRVFASPGAATRCLVATFTAASIVAMLAVRVLIEAWFDRYLVAMVPALAALLVGHASRRRLLLRPGLPTRSALVAAAMYAVIALAIVDASAAYDGARWDLAARTTARGVDASTIDGGFEWFSFHQPGAIGSGVKRTEAPFWVGAFAGTACETVTAAPHPGPVRDTNQARTAFGVLRLSLIDGPDRC